MEEKDFTIYPLEHLGLVGSRLRSISQTTYSLFLPRQTETKSSRFRGKENAISWKACGAGGGI
ncbi:hypothetical protein DRO02_03230 [archaeon]|nr:MAG: hypothetical protein DRO02_03230 [archaeon]RLG65219.1 MAG: hypothetical protein DRO21_02320 [archaeon]